MNVIGETPRRAIDLIADRRRPGRLRIGNPHLIALLRRQFSSDVRRDEADFSSNPELYTGDAEPDSLSAARGVIFGAMVGASMWAAIILCLWLAFWR